MVITFLTDFGLPGRLRRRLPRRDQADRAGRARSIDITHGIAPQAVLQGALALANTLPYMPAGVHLAVVDPGVGTGRRALALRSGDGRFFVGPDNGLLVPAAERLGGIEAAHELTNPEYMLEPVSRTFHGRDVFSPAAAHLASGVDARRVRPAARRRDARPARHPRAGRLARPDPGDRDRRRPLRERPAQPAPRAPRARSGSSRAAASSSSWRSTATTPSPRARSRTRGRGDIVLYEDSYRNVAIAINGGNASEMFGVKPGRELRIRVEL